MTETTTRIAGLRQMLITRRREMQHDVRSRIRHGRTDRPDQVRDDLEHSDTDAQDDIERSLLHMRSEMLGRLDVALVRLDAGKYGACLDCEREIAERRLHALPFAVRCQVCQERREQAARTARKRDVIRNGVSLFPDAVGA
jgi:RNA polymerase-binding transcription factor DksA